MWFTLLHRICRLLLLLLQPPPRVFSVSALTECLVAFCPTRLGACVKRGPSLSSPPPRKESADIPRRRSPPHPPTPPTPPAAQPAKAAPPRMSQLAKATAVTLYFLFSPPPSDDRLRRRPIPILTIRPFGSRLNFSSVHRCRIIYRFFPFFFWLCREGRASPS